MSLAIDTNAVTGVLLADGWHVVAGQSFDLDAYEFIESRKPAYGDEIARDPAVILGGGRAEGVCATGATWREKSGARISCPLTSVLAVRCANRP